MPWQLVNLQKNEQKQPAFVSVNPMGKLPAITHRGAVITETGAICAYLADAFPQAGLAPSLDDPARGSYLRWMFFGAACGDSAALGRRSTEGHAGDVPGAADQHG